MLLSSEIIIQVVSSIQNLRVVLMAEKTESIPSTEHRDMLSEKTPDDMAVAELKCETMSLESTSAEYKATEKRLVRKLDLTLIPMLWVLYLFNYLDRNNIAQARLNTFEEDLGLVGNQFNVAVSILNVSYMLMQLPR